MGPNSSFRREARGNNIPASFKPEFSRYNASGVWKAWSGIQETESENHNGWYRYSREAKTDLIDRGGEFTTQKSWVRQPVTPAAQTWTSGWFYPDGQNQYQVKETRTGAILPIDVPSMPFPTSVRSSENELMALGTTAIARCSPTNSVASLSTTLTELYREGIPKMLGSSFWESRARVLRDAQRNLGDEYLNVQFGWKPLISDITDIANVIVKSQDLLTQAQRDSGRVVRRRYNFPPIRTLQETTVLDRTSPSPVGNIDSAFLYEFYNRGKVTRFRETYKRQWFSGAFTYHLPDYGSGLVKQFGQASDLLGLDLNPEVLWNITPWSWAVDWFTNIGDVIHNANTYAKYGLVLKYGYIMEHSYVSDMYSFSGPTGFKSRVYPYTVELVTETKLRRRATPFGFGLSLGALSGTQKAILAALGITRTK